MWQLHLFGSASKGGGGVEMRACDDVTTKINMIMCDTCMSLCSLVPRPSATLFLFAYVTFEPLSDKLAEGLVPLLRHLQAKWTRL